MMRQYEQAKAACGDALLAFRMGDFYELFYDDAVTAARVLGLTLTSRDKGENPTPMAGFPYHQLDAYLAKLVKLGYRVGICDQVEDPKRAKGLVKRQVTRIVSPGTITDHELLDPRQANYLAALAVAPRPGSANAADTNEAHAAAGNALTFGLAWIDLSGGEFSAMVASEPQVIDHLARLAPSEVLLSDAEAEIDLPRFGITAATRRPAWSFGPRRALEVLLRRFHLATVEGLGFDATADQVALAAAGAIVEYVQETQAGALDLVERLVPYRVTEGVQIDHATWASLEVTRTLRDGRRDGSLVGVMDRTTTAMGARRLASWLGQPLCDAASIGARQDAVAELVEHTALAAGLRAQTGGMSDVQRLVARLVAGRAMPRDLAALRDCLAKVPRLKSHLDAVRSQLLIELNSQLDPCTDLHDLLERALEEHCPAQGRDGPIIRAGFDPRLDELRQLAHGGKQWIAGYQARLIEQTGIPTLRVGFNKVFGYYVEVTHAQAGKVPLEFVRKQTIKNAERYITPELKEYEERVLTADQEAADLESVLVDQLRAAALAETGKLKRLGDALATIDALGSLAQLAAERGYCRPQIVPDPVTIIRDGRHPVLDILQPLGAFVPNDTMLDGADNGSIWLITGPNMAGKSTYIRQVALITLMAQIGSFVPAASATIGLVDRIFARVGATDELTKGQSTFMVEMTETARILNTATARSLVVLDEIGRGTSTYDGVSLAWAIVEYLHDEVGCRTLFATHYHELTELSKSLAALRNYNIAVQEWEDRVVFLHKILPGATDRSYGIHVAQLAGIPPAVNRRAQQILNQLELDRDTPEARAARIESATSRPQEVQLTLFGPATHPLVEKIRRIDPDHVTPMAALKLIHQWQKELNTGDA